MSDAPKFTLAELDLFAWRQRSQGVGRLSTLTEGPLSRLTDTVCPLSGSVRLNLVKLMTSSLFVLKQGLQLEPMVQSNQRGTIFMSKHS